MIVAAAPAPPVPAPPGKPPLPILSSSLRRGSSSWWFSSGTSHGRDGTAATTSSRATRRRWWSDPDGSQEDYGSSSLEEEEYDYDYDYEDDAGFPGFGGAGELFDEPWFSKVYTGHRIFTETKLPFHLTPSMPMTCGPHRPASSSFFAFLLFPTRMATSRPWASATVVVPLGHGGAELPCSHMQAAAAATRGHGQQQHLVRHGQAAAPLHSHGQAALQQYLVRHGQATAPPYIHAQEAAAPPRAMGKLAASTPWVSSRSSVHLRHGRRCRRRALVVVSSSVETALRRLESRPWGFSSSTWSCSSRQPSFGFATATATPQGSSALHGRVGAPSGGAPTAMAVRELCPAVSEGHDGGLLPLDRHGSREQAVTVSRRR